MIEFISTVRRKVKTFRIPENYNELSREQLMKLSMLFLTEIPVDVAQMEALRILLKKSRIKFFLMPLDVKAGMLEHIEWVLRRNGLTRQFLPTYRPIWAPWEKFYGPAGDWDNLTMAEWNACEVFYEWMVNGKDNRAIDMLIAVLYRLPKSGYNTIRDTDGDIRQPYNQHEVPYWAKKVGKWPMAVKMAILTWYDGCREYMVNTYDVFETGTGDQEKKAPGMFELIRGLCGTRYGSFEEVEKMNVHKALREMELMKQEAEKINRQIPTA